MCRAFAGEVGIMSKPSRRPDREAIKEQRCKKNGKRKRYESSR